MAHRIRKEDIDMTHVGAAITAIVNGECNLSEAVTGLLSEISPEYVLRAAQRVASNAPTQVAAYAATMRGHAGADVAAGNRAMQARDASTATQRYGWARRTARKLVADRRTFSDVDARMHAIAADKFSDVPTRGMAKADQMTRRLP